MPTIVRLFAVFLVAGVRTVMAAPGDVLQVFRDPTPAVGNNFGFAVTTIGNHVLVSAPRADQAGHDTGAAFLFDSRGELLQTFLPPNPSLGDYFAQNAIAGVGGNVVIGDPGNDDVLDDAGAVHVFDRATGQLQRTIRKSFPSVGNGFGYTVGALGENLLVGELNDGPGAVHLYDASTGSFIHTFANPTPGPRDEFGFAFASVGGNVVIGANKDDTSATDAGAVYVFDGASGDLLRTILNPSPEAGDGFGRSVAALGTNILVGAWSDDTGAQNAGAAYLFDGATGQLLHTFLNPEPDVNDQFGNSIVAAGDNVLIGAYFDGYGSPEAGSAYLFSGTTGRLLLTLHNPDPSPGDLYSRFGWSVAALGNDLLVGANGGGNYEPTIGGTACNCNVGAVYLIQVPEPSALNISSAGAIAFVAAWASAAIRRRSFCAAN